MVSTESEISAHYNPGNLLARLNAALIDDGIDPEHPTMEALAPYDQFHGRALEAAMEESRTIRCLGRQARVPVSYRLQRKPDGACSRRDSTSFGCRAPSRRRALLAPARARWSSAERSRRTAL